MVDTACRQGRECRPLVTPAQREADHMISHDSWRQRYELHVYIAAVHRSRVITGHLTIKHMKSYQRWHDLSAEITCWPCTRDHMTSVEITWHCTRDHMHCPPGVPPEAVPRPRQQSPAGIPRWCSSWDDWRSCWRRIPTQPGHDPRGRASGSAPEHWSARVCVCVCVHVCVLWRKMSWQVNSSQWITAKINCQI